MDNFSRNLLLNFNNSGYSIINVLNPSKVLHFKKKITRKLKELSKKNSLHSKFKKFSTIEDYHKLPLTDLEHDKLMKSYHRNIKLSKKESNFFVNKYFDTLFEYFYGNEAPQIKFGLSKKFKLNLFGFRIVRPKEKAVAGYHTESTNGVHCFTLWIPLTGTSPKYTLKILPKSHLYRHKNQNILRNKKFLKAQLFKKNYVKKFGNFKRPNMKLGQGIFFHPDLIHGDSKNLGSKTRVSMELKFIRKDIKNRIIRSREIIR